MRRSRAGLAALVAWAGLAGCASILPKAPSTTHYDLEYTPERVDCPRSWPAPVSVWGFGAAAPYDRNDMVVVDGRKVSFSEDHQWVARPGELVAQALMHDLAGGGLFPLVVSARDPGGAPLQLSGTVYRFAWEKQGGSARAALTVDVVLRRAGEGVQPLLHRRYELSSPPQAATDDASAFARAMSAVVGQLSTRVRRDLCAAIPEATTSRSGHGSRG